MRAFQLGPDGQASLREVAVPSARGKAVLLRVEAAGLCHSDIHLIETGFSRPDHRPFTLGHEIAGRVESCGDDVKGLAVGDRVAVYAPLGCGKCATCDSGSANYCPMVVAGDSLALGIGADGGMAEFVLVPDFRHLVPIGDMSAVAAAPLTDAGLTPFHAISRSSRLKAGGAVTVVIGVGGLGHLAVQVLTATSDANVIAVDLRQEALDLAVRGGASEAVPAGPGLEKELTRLLGRRRCDVVLDFVGAPETMALALAVLAPGGELSVVGSAGGSLVMAKSPGQTKGVQVTFPFWGTLPELNSVVSLAKSGSLHVETEVLPLDAVSEAVMRLKDGSVTGRIVLVP
ncbi:NAD(P)-dependent alcohol dehydrogenase [Dietzia sp. CH92]|uniref:NAD(P)-dependent alcohol dehydrogenase n=1 Tax=Dietzia sp. CH92 TaxID=3051823 RepID=UPI0028D6884D|nr:NAD(P)-dependent alcohol dehydrogenase [Dietzia sp. CH92]